MQKSDENQTRIHRYYLAICATFRDEAQYLREWIEFHRMVGVEHFFLYNNFSQDSYKEVLEPWVSKGLVTVINWPVSFADRGHSRAHEHCIENYGFYARWIAFIDVDEFLFSPESQLLQNTLKDYEEYPGVVVNWQVYGSSGHQQKPVGLVIESFIMRAKIDWVRNQRMKSIVDPLRVAHSNSEHFFIYTDRELAVTENYRQVKVKEIPRRLQKIRKELYKFHLIQVDPYVVREASVKKVSVNRLRINHYAVKSYQEFYEKLARHNHNQRKYRLEYFKFHDKNQVFDPILHRHLPELKHRIQDI